jgi:hypothetical protein
VKQKRILIGLIVGVLCAVSLGYAVFASGSSDRTDSDIIGTPTPAPVAVDGNDTTKSDKAASPSATPDPVPVFIETEDEVNSNTDLEAATTK